MNHDETTDEPAAVISEREPGVYPDLSSHDYHSGPGISNTDLGLLLRSPAHYMAKDSFVETAAMLLGRAFHTLILEPELFDAEFAIWDGPSRATTKGKEMWAEFQIEHAGKDVITPKQEVDARAMAKSALAHPGARVLLDGATREQSLFWRDEETGVLCKCRHDCILPDGTGVDFKSTIDARREKFFKSAYDLGYHRQGDFYSEGRRRALGIDDAPFIWFAIEKTPPFAVKLHFMDEAQAELGNVEWRKAVRIYAECDAAGKWPAYSPDIEALGLPAWAAKPTEITEPGE